jgi:hypothetical protein
MLKEEKKLLEPRDSAQAVRRCLVSLDAKQQKQQIASAD